MRKLGFIFILFIALTVSVSSGFCVNYTADGNCEMALLLDVSEDPQTDTSGNGNTAAAVNDPAYTASGKFNGGYDYDGGNDGHLVSDSNSLDNATGVGQARTWMYWINTYIALANKLITDKSNFAGLHFWSEGQSDTSKTRIDGGVATTGKLSTVTLLEAGTWYHIVFMYDGTDTSLYVDGLLEDGPQAQTPTGDDANDFRIACSGGSYAIDAQMDEIAIFSRALDSTEINDIMDNGLEGAAAAPAIMQPIINIF